MKASELIKQIQEQMEFSGDAEVYFEYPADEDQFNWKKLTGQMIVGGENSKEEQIILITFED